MCRSALECCEMAPRRMAYSYFGNSALSIQIVDLMVRMCERGAFAADRLNPTGAGEVHRPTPAPPPPAENRQGATDHHLQG